MIFSDDDEVTINISLLRIRLCLPCTGTAQYQASLLRCTSKVLLCVCLAITEASSDHRIKVYLTLKFCLCQYNKCKYNNTSFFNFI